MYGNMQTDCTYCNGHSKFVSNRNITPITCRQVYWLYHKNSLVYTPVLNPISSACLKIAGLPFSNKLEVRSRKHRAVQCTSTKKKT